jgi:hypothetical protein
LEVLRSVDVFATGRLVNEQCIDVKDFDRVIAENSQGMAAFP